MTDQELARMKQALRGAVARIHKFQDQTLGEQNTKASLIEPMLEALGWDIRDPDVVTREFRTTGQDKPVDYALRLVRQPRLLVEAKALGEELAEHKWLSQVVSYATVAGVEWCVLTDGNVYRFYNATARVPAAEKLFYEVKLTECDEDEAIQKLSWLAPAFLEKNLLNELWNSHFVDRGVRAELLRMTEAPDKGLIKLLHHRLKHLASQQVAQSLRRLTVRIEMPTILPPGQKPTGRGKKTDSTKSKRSKKQRTGLIPVSLVDLIAAHLLHPPVRLFRKYKGNLVEATLQPDGKVTYQGQVYDSCSTAAEMARGTITGKRMNTNGWVFWQYEDSDGNKSTLGDARQRLQDMKAKPPR